MKVRKHFQRKDKIVEDFIILNQVVSEKTLMKNVHMFCLFVLFDSLRPLNNLSVMRDGLPGLNQY